MYCKTIWIWSLKVGNVKCGSFFIWDFFGLRLHKEATQWRIQGRGVREVMTPPPSLSGKYNVLVNNEYV